MKMETWNSIEHIVTGHSSSKRNFYLGEFANDPKAQLLRIRYRIIWLCANLTAFIVLLACVVVRSSLTSYLNFHLGSAGYIPLTFLSIASGMLYASDHNFVIFAMKRRAKLEARSRPNVAEKLLWFYLPPETADEAIEHLNTKFEDRKKRYNTGFARRWYWWQVIRSCSPTFDQLIERAIKWGLFEWVRRELFK